MVRYFIQFGYIGTKFRGVQSHGKQYRIDSETIAGLFESALQKFRPKTWPTFFGSSRTDKGVHAFSTTCHVDLIPEYSEYDPHHITVGLNRYFEKADAEIRVHRTVIVPDSFNARHEACSRTYLYRVAVLRDLPPVLSFSRYNLQTLVPVVELNRSWVLSSRFHIDKVEEGATYLKGTWDFSSFAGANSDRSPIRTLLEASVSKGRPLMDPKYEPLYNNIDIWDFTFVGQSFVYRQVRRMVGALVAVGHGALAPQQIKYMLENPSKDSWPAGANAAPAYGLYLVSVNYPEGSLPDQQQQTIKPSSNSNFAFDSDSEDEQ